MKIVPEPKCRTQTETISIDAAQHHKTSARLPAFAEGNQSSEEIIFGSTLVIICVLAEIMSLVNDIKKSHH